MCDYAVIILASREKWYISQQNNELYEYFYLPVVLLCLIEQRGKHYES